MPSDYYRVYHMCTKFGADSSNRFPFRVQTDKQTDATERSTHASGYNYFISVSNK